MRQLDVKLCKGEQLRASRSLRTVRYSPELNPDEWV
jgi:hypothetical protein